MSTPPRSLARMLNELTHTDRFQFVDVLRMLQQVFVSHDTDDVESQFGVGLPSTTPAIGDVRARVAQPWFFARVLAFLGLAFVAVLVAYQATDNPLLVPALVFTGSFATPIAVAIFFSNVIFQPIYPCMRSCACSSGVASWVLCSR